MSVPKAVVFDLGKVLLDFDYSIAARKLLANGESRHGAEELQRIVDHSELLSHMETGLITPEAFFEEVRKLSGYRGSFDEFAELFGDIFEEIGPMVAMQARLRSAGLKTYIFSNTNDLAIRFIKRSFSFFANFDGYVYSYVEKCMKPDPPIYEAVERLAGLNGSDLVYIDDREENFVAGRERGWTRSPAGSAVGARSIMYLSRPRAIVSRPLDCRPDDRAFQLASQESNAVTNSLLELKAFESLRLLRL